MAISYNKLWKQLIDKNMTKADLRLKADIGTATLAKLRKNGQVSIDIILRIYKTLDCYIADIMKLIRGSKDV